MYNKAKQVIFYMSCLKNFNILDVLENHRNACFEVNVKQSIEMPENVCGSKKQC